MRTQDQQHRPIPCNECSNKSHHDVKGFYEYRQAPSTTHHMNTIHPHQTQDCMKPYVEQNSEHEHPVNTKTKQ